MLSRKVLRVTKPKGINEIPRPLCYIVIKCFGCFIQVRRARHAGHCWRSKDELISDVLLWTPTYGQAKAGRPARTYIQQLCEDTGCNPEDLQEAMNDREKWWEMVRDIRAGGTTSWWWWCGWRNNWGAVKIKVDGWATFYQHTFYVYLVLKSWIQKYR